MIDTIRLRIQCENTNDVKLSNIVCVRLGYLRYKIYRDFINIGSYSYNVNIFINDYSELFIEYSVPKLLYGNNIHEASLTDFEKSIKIVRKALSKYVTMRPTEEWEVMRVDFCKYITSDDPYNDISFYQSLEYPRQFKYLYDTSVMFVGKSYSTKFYLKHEEFLKHDFKEITKTDPKRALQLSKESKGKIRVETTYRRNALKKILKSNKIPISLFFKYSSRLQEHFNKIVASLNVTANPQNFTQHNLLRELSKKYKPKRAMDIYMFYKCYFASDYNKRLAKEYLSRSTVYRYKKIISDTLQKSERSCS